MYTTFSLPAETRARSRLQSQLAPVVCLSLAETDSLCVGQSGETNAGHARKPGIA